MSLETRTKPGDSFILKAGEDISAGEQLLELEIGENGRFTWKMHPKAMFFRHDKPKKLDKDKPDGSN